MDIPQELEEQILRHEGYARIDSHNLPLRMRLGDLYHQAGRLDDALDCYEACDALKPGHPAARSRAASVLISMHRFADAQSVLQELLSAGEADPALHHNLGLAHYYQEHWDDAAAQFSLAEDAGLASASNCAYLARSLHQDGQLIEAITACRRWTQLAPGTESLSYLSLLLLDAGNTEEARSTALEVLESAPGDADANVALGVWALEQQESAMAQEHFETALQTDVGNGRAWLGSGLAFLYEGRHAEAVTFLSRAAEIFPDNVGILVTLGWARLLASDTVGARDAFAQAVALDEHDAESRGGLASVLAIKKDVAGAQEQVAIARRIDPDSAGADIAQTFIYAAQGESDAVADVLARMLKRSPRPGAAPLADQLRIFVAKRSHSAKPTRTQDITLH
jgi:tetratricopeptide (TPR) repeat protein